MDEAWRYYAKWIQSDGERQMPYDFVHMWNIKTNKKPKKKEDTEDRKAVTRGEHKWLKRGDYMVTDGN